MLLRGAQEVIAVLSCAPSSKRVQPKDDKHIDTLEAALPESLARNAQPDLRKMGLWEGVSKKQDQEQSKTKSFRIASLL